MKLECKFLAIQVETWVRIKFRTKKISGPINYNKQTKKFFIFAIFKGKIEVCAKKSLKNMF